MKVWVVTVHCQDTSGDRWDYALGIYTTEALARDAIDEDKNRWAPSAERPDTEYDVQERQVIGPFVG